MRLRCIGLPALAAAAVYLGTLGADFVFDDRSQILFNPWVRELSNFTEAVSRPVWAFRVSYATNYFRPFQMGSYNLLWAASNGSPAAFHALNVLLHVVATMLVGLLALRLSRDSVVAFGAALLFAVHPVHSEAVAWIACLPELGLAAFALGALLLHAESWEAAPPRRRLLRVSSCVLAALALASKETAVVLPGLVFLLEALCGPSGEARERIRVAVAQAVPYVLIAAGYLALRRIVVGSVAIAQGGATLPEALWTAPQLALAYAGKLAWPAVLQAYYVVEPVRSPAGVAFLLPLAAVIAGLTAGLWAVRRRGDLAFALGLTCLPLLPALAAPATGVTFFSERYIYLPSAGAVWLAAAALLVLARRLRLGPRPAIALLVVLALFGAWRTAGRHRVWANDEALARDTLAREPRARPMWGLLATWQGTHGRIEDALETYREALARFPGDTPLEVEELNTRFLLHRISAEEFVRELEPRIRRDPTLYEAHFYLGTAQARAGDPEAAEAAFRDAIRLNPSFKPAYDGLTAALLAQGITGAASLGLSRASGFSLGTAADRLLEGASYLRAGDIDRAEAAFREVLREEPGSSRALLALAVVASRRGDPREAVDYGRRAVAADPDFVDAWQQLGVSALALGDVAEAVRALEAAVKLNPNDKEVQNRLGAAYATAGRRDEARAAWERALAIDPRFEKARHNLARLDERP